MNQKILVGVAWPYVNGDLHLGHLAGYLLPADMFARFQRLRGNDVLMISGSDCHGTPITVEADKSGKTPAEIVKTYHQQDIELFKLYDLSYNLYTDTTTEQHMTTVQEMFLDLLKSGYIVKDTMQQYYAEADQQFLPDRYVEGTCPHCGTHEQRSDQCEACGRWLADGELLNPISKLTKAAVSLKATEHYFLDFEKITPQLREYVDSRKGIWRNWVWQETNSWLTEGLKKRAITRDMDWAIDLPIEEIKKLPADKQLKDFTGKKIYVWFEAVIGYLSAVKQWSTITSADNIPDNVIYSKTSGQATDWKEWWLNKDARIFNFMGQDNLVFHTLMWPAQLIGTGKDYTLPENVVVNKFLNLEGKKFSKSRNWTINSRKMAETFSTDLVRYYMVSNFPENKEGDFTWQGFVASVNNELVANLGNFINRSLKFYEAKLSGKLTSNEYVLDKHIEQRIKDTFINCAAYIDKVELVAGFNQIMELSRFGNKYFDDEKIWVVVKTDTAKAEQIMFNLLNIVNAFKLLMIPFLPNAAKQLAETLGTDLEISAYSPEVNHDLWQPEIAKSFKLIKDVTILFNKLDLTEVLSIKESLR